MVVFLGCKDNDKVEDDIAKLDVNLEIARFDREFAEAEPLDIPVLKKAYPYLFPAQYTDSVWVAKLQDSLQIELLSEVDNEFSDFSEEKDDLILLFKHIKYYFPNYQLPKVVTVTSDVSYDSRIIMTDSLLLIGLDNYLGPDHKFYQSFPNYIAAGLDKQYLVSDVANAFAKQVVPKPKDRTFLGQMIYYGKELATKDKLAPFISDGQKINYSEAQLAWAKANEEQIWRNFIENEYLYSTDNKLVRRFLDQAPFSKFGLELDNESPGRIGRFLGWQIVRAFMEKNEVTLQQMLSLPAEEIFKKSNYKPEK
ncbi:gliding motility lipoprotein GldB [Pricia sp. S334]|uniref:Gliding motility lipoprotein GldB n=1 Tax=Pricia mediterranea TaxID=3076079 RepID=A0ABU3L3P7_9FLAO|nr:gliding motility lipoprotein GldB [Pricia sp. S334]MDT7828062.1 gliding motility lipoprotein GldB [Pricia sp. S334]